jgi:large subunit ribosomal protein L9
MGVPATPGLLKQVERRREKERQRLLEEKQVATELKTAIEAVGSFTIAKQVGEENAIFGTVTAPEVATAIQQATGKEVDRRNISLPDIGETGTYKAEIKLHPEITAVVQIQVVAS